MKYDLNVKQLAKSMHVHDKVRMLIADVEEKMKTDSKGLLSESEKDAIVEDAHKKHELSELNRIYNLYVLEGGLYMDTYSRLQALLIQFASLERILLMIGVAGFGRDAIDRIVHDLVPDKDKKTVYKEYESDMKTLNKYILIQDDKPHPDLVEAVDSLIKVAKVVRKFLYQIEYVQHKTEVKIIMDDHQEIYDSCEELIQSIINFDASLRLLRVLRDYEVLDDSDESKELLDMVQNIEQRLTLSEQDKQEAEAKIEKYLEK